MIALAQFLGFMMVLQGVSGSIAVLADKPDFGFFLNFFNRHVVSHVDFLNGWELLADALIIILGITIILVAEKRKVSA